MRFPFGKTRRPQVAEFTAPLAPDEAFCVIGDIHGALSRLAALDARLDDPDLPDRIICVGDYIDRGDDSAETLAWLHARQTADPDRMTCLMGNHERMLLDFLDAPERAGPRWMRHGGMQTLASYRIAAPGRGARATHWQAAAEDLRHAIGGGILAWLHALPLTWRSGNVAVVHAAADPARGLDEQEERALLWGHPAFAQSPRQDGLWVVHGHTIVAEPQARDGRISVDTGAFASGRLSAAVIRPGQVDFVTT